MLQTEFRVWSGTFICSVGAALPALVSNQAALWCQLQLHRVVEFVKRAAFRPGDVCLLIMTVVVRSQGCTVCLRAARIHSAKWRSSWDPQNCQSAGGTHESDKKVWVKQPERVCRFHVPKLKWDWCWFFHSATPGQLRGGPGGRQKGHTPFWQRAAAVPDHQSP